MMKKTNKIYIIKNFKQRQITYLYFIRLIKKNTLNGILSICINFYFSQLLFCVLFLFIRKNNYTYIYLFYYLKKKFVCFYFSFFYFIFLNIIKKINFFLFLH